MAPRWCNIVVFCTDLSGREPHRQITMGRAVTSGSLVGVMVSTLVRDVGSIFALGPYFPLPSSS